VQCRCSADWKGFAGRKESRKQRADFTDLPFTTRNAVANEPFGRPPRFWFEVNVFIDAENAKLAIYHNTYVLLSSFVERLIENYETDLQKQIL